MVRGGLQTGCEGRIRIGRGSDLTLLNGVGFAFGADAGAFANASHDESGCCFGLYAFCVQAVNEMAEKDEKGRLHADAHLRRAYHRCNTITSTVNQLEGFSGDVHKLPSELLATEAACSSNASV